MLIIVIYKIILCRMGCLEKWNSALVVLQEREELMSFLSQNAEVRLVKTSFSYEKIRL